MSRSTPGLGLRARYTQKVPATMRALIQHINRKLATERGYVLKITRGNRWRGKLGDYYAVDPKRTRPSQPGEAASPCLTADGFSEIRHQ